MVGLSPRERGNPATFEISYTDGGSIPARAGNRLAQADAKDSAGSIPARAGEP